jgi:signal transduction histidine kinase
MAGKASRPTFFWQGVLILLPVAGLAYFGLGSLRQDRVFAEQEARDSGEVLAQRLAQAIGIGTVQQLRDYRNANFALQANLWLSPSWPGGAQMEDTERQWQQANPETDSATFYADAQAEMMPPQPPDWLVQLNSDQRQLWQAAKESEFNAKDFSTVKAAFSKFLATKPPKGARANAMYLPLIAKTQGMDAAEAAALIAQYSSTRWADSGQLTDSGLPLGQLICYQALRRLPDGAGLPRIFIRDHNIPWMIAYRPSFFSPILIAETERVVRGTSQEKYAAMLKAWWDTEAAARQVMEDFREQHPTNTWNTAPFWVDSSIGKFLLLLGDRQMTPTNYNYVLPQTVYYDHLLFPEAVLEKALASAVSKSGIPLPSYARVEFEIAGREITLSSNQANVTTNRSLPVLGQAGGVFKDLSFNPYSYPFRIQVSLASPEILFARQKQRTRMFGALIAASALAALIGFVAAHRAFRREQQLSEAKSNFVSSVSHELRAPIASVRLMAESLERGKVNEVPKQNEYFRFIVQECRRLSSLIENVLDFSRIEQGRKQYEFEPTDLAALTRETVKLMEPYAAEKGVCLELDSNLETQNPELEIDGRAMQQALVNLMDNAIKHSPKGAGVKIGFECDGHFARLWVEDCGPGIPPEEQERIFERFYRLGSELRRETQGVGIGLSIVRHIVEAHGGKVTVRSSVGQGSRFTIELPQSSNLSENEGS